MATGQRRQMSSRQRVLAAMKHQEVDHVPCSPIFNPLYQTQWVGHRYQFPWSPSDQVGRIEYCVREFDADPFVETVFSETPPPEVSSRIWLEGSVLHKVWRTPAGELHAAIRYNPQWPHGKDIPFYTDFNIGHFAIPWLKTERDLECLRHILRPLDERADLERCRERYRQAKQIADRWHLPTFVWIGSGLTGAMQMAGAQQLCLMVMDNPALVDAYLDWDHSLIMRRIEVAADLGVDVIHRQGFYETCDFYSPAMLERLLFRRLQEEIEAVHRAGKVISYTVHTGVMPMLDYLSRLDFDCLAHIDIAFRGVDLKAIRDSQGGRKSFWIGPSGTFHMWSDDPQDVRAAVRQVFDVFGKQGLIITPCPSAHSIMPWENTLAMIDEWRKLR